MNRVLMNSNVRGWNRLSVRIVVIVILCSSLLTLITTAFQLYFDYQKDVKSIHTNILFIEESYLPAIVFSVYTLDMEQVKILLEGTLNIIDIEYIEIDNTSNNIIKSAGNPTASRDVIRVFPLDYTTASGKKISLGTLKVSASFEGIYKRLVEEAYLSLLSNMLRMFVAALIFLAIINSIIIRHLKKVSNFTQDLNLDELDKELTLDRKTSKLSKYDELDQLVSSLNDMQSRILQDIIERKQVESTLRIERNNLKNIFNSMQDGIYIVNKDYDIEYVNPVLIKDFGPPEGKKCYMYFHNFDEPCSFCKNKDVFAGKTVGWEWTSPKGKTYDLIDTPLKNADGSVSKLEIFRDITERKQAEEALKKYRVHLEELVKERTVELERKNKKLEEFNDLFVNREFRIAELKERIKELENNNG